MDDWVELSLLPLVRSARSACHQLQLVPVQGLNAVSAGGGVMGDATHSAATGSLSQPQPSSFATLLVTDCSLQWPRHRWRACGIHTIPTMCFSGLWPGRQPALLLRHKERSEVRWLLRAIPPLRPGCCCWRCWWVCSRSIWMAAATAADGFDWMPAGDPATFCLSAGMGALFWMISAF